MKVLSRYTRSRAGWQVWLAALILCMICLTGISAPFIASSKPWYIKNNDKIYFPVFSARKTYELRSPDGNIRTYPVNLINWSKFDAGNGTVYFAPVPYDAGASDLLNANFQPPFSRGECAQYPEGRKPCDPPFVHWLGTNLKGEDVLSGLIHGTSVSLRISFFSMVIAFLIGIVLGMTAGYLGNKTIRIPLLSAFGLVLVIVPVFYFSQLFVFLFTSLNDLPAWIELLSSIIIVLLVTVLLILPAYYSGKIFHKLFRWKKQVNLPLDTIISRFIEFFASVPKLMLVVALAALMERGVNQVIFIIGISSWAGIARLVRAEAQKIRTSDFIVSSRALGLSHFRIMWNHILPNIRIPLIVSFVFGVSGAILIESGLSFLNIGVPENVITWGRLLADGRQNFNALWLIVFPGLAIFITTLCLNILGENLESKNL